MGRGGLANIELADGKVLKNAQEVHGKRRGLEVEMMVAKMTNMHLILAAVEDGRLVLI